MLINNKNLTGPVLNKWNDYLYPIENLLITENTIKNSLLSFESFLLESNLNLNKNISILIFFKVKTSNHQWRTISYMQSLNIKDLTTLEQIFIEYWNLKDEEYNLEQYSQIIYTYYIIDSFSMKSKIVKANKYKNINNNYNLKNIKIGKYNLPCTMDFYTWGNVHYLEDRNVIVYKKNSDLEFHITIFDKYQEVDLKLNDKIILSFKDIMNDNYDLTTFTREFKNQYYRFIEGELKLKKVYKKVSFITNTLRKMYLTSYYITMDLETRIINNKMTAYCVSIYDGKIFKSFYLICNVSVHPSVSIRDSLYLGAHFLFYRKKI